MSVKVVNIYLHLVQQIIVNYCCSTFCRVDRQCAYAHVLYKIIVTFILISVAAEIDIKGVQISFVEDHWLLVGFLARAPYL